jgi:hypothetical protein
MGHGLSVELATSINERGSLQKAESQHGRGVAGLACTITAEHAPKLASPLHTYPMRATKRQRPLARTIKRPLSDEKLEELSALAERTRYVGSAEHKSYPSFAGSPRLRADASRCDPSLTDANEITAWLREGISCGNIGEFFEGDFPRYVWIKRGTIVYEGRLVNREQGQYKGYPLAPNELPEGL